MEWKTQEPRYHRCRSGDRGHARRDRRPGRAVPGVGTADRRRGLDRRIERRAQHRFPGRVCRPCLPDGLDLYMASNRPGYIGASTNLDIWVSHRAGKSAPWGTPVNLGAPVNSAVDDFCPTPTLGGGLFFVSVRAVAGACGGADIYFTRRRHEFSWTEPRNLGCQVNSAAGEAGPSLVLEGLRPVLYFSSTRAGGFSAEAPGAVSGGLGHLRESALQTWIRPGDARSRSQHVGERFPTQCEARRS